MDFSTIRDDLTQGARYAGDLVWSTPRRRAVVGGIAAALVVAGGVGGFMAWRANQVPDFATADLDLVLDFAFLEPSFNDLPVDERARLIGDLVGRFEGMSGSDSVLIAAFAASVQGAAREQIEANASQLMIDMVDVHAADYRDVPPEQRVEYIEQRVIEIARTINIISGQDPTASDQEILDRARRDAKRDQQAFRSERFTPDRAGRMFSFMHDGIGTHATAHQRARLGVFMRDMTAVLRGEPLD